MVGKREHGCPCRQAAVTGCRRLGKGAFTNNRHSFLTLLEAGKPKIKALADLVSGEVPLPGSQTAIFTLCAHMVERSREPLGPLF